MFDSAEFLYRFNFCFWNACTRNVWILEFGFENVYIYIWVCVGGTETEKQRHIWNNSFVFCDKVLMGRYLGMRKIEKIEDREYKIWGQKVLHKQHLVYYLLGKNGQAQSRAKSQSVGKENPGYFQHSCFRIDSLSLEQSQVPWNCNLDSFKTLAPASDQSCQVSSWTKTQN